MVHHPRCRFELAPPNEIQRAWTLRGSTPGVLEWLLGGLRGGPWRCSLALLDLFLLPQVHPCMCHASKYNSPSWVRHPSFLTECKEGHGQQTYPKSRNQPQEIPHTTPIKTDLPWTTPGKPTARRTSRPARLARPGAQSVLTFVLAFVRPEGACVWLVGGIPIGRPVEPGFRGRL